MPTYTPPQVREHLPVVLLLDGLLAHARLSALAAARPLSPQDQVALAYTRV